MVKCGLRPGYQGHLAAPKAPHWQSTGAVRDVVIPS
jgi:hypothetical protein